MSRFTSIEEPLLTIDNSPLTNSDKKVQECDATGLTSSTEAGLIKIAFFVNQLTCQILPVSYLRLSILIITALLAGCAGNVIAQSNEVVLTDVPEKLEPTTIPEMVSKSPPADCPVTTTGSLSFEAPAPYSPSAPWPSQFWFGSEQLWTVLSAGGVWPGLPNNPDGYTQKIFWWSSLFSLKDELEPGLVVFGERLDAKAPPLKVSRATNAFAKDIGDAMLVGVDFPTLGCWEITGQYKKTELSFVVWVAP